MASGSSIEKLSIRGIRSFSPDRDQVIEFYSPLTMIVGHNGCGKTTIIECLKYMLTGTLPPGTKSGQYFINDPKVSGAQEVKANIKLRLRNRAGQGMVSIRYFQLTQSRTRLTFKALDGVIRTFGANGETESMSHKCSEMDKQMPILLGVSKAILENVVFCHQEEANWPLMEGKFLKEKFDDIFEATRYSKALEAIRKSKKAQGEVVKELKVDLAGLDERLATAGQIQADLDKAERQLNRNNDAIAAADDSITGLDEELARLTAELDRLGAQQAEVDAKRARVESRAKEVEIQSRSIELMPEESDAELRQLVDGVGLETAQVDAELAQLQETMSTRRKAMRQATMARENLVSELGELKAQIALLHRAQHERDGLLRRLSEKYSIPLPTATAAAAGDAADGNPHVFDDAAVKRFVAKLRERLADTGSALEAVRSETRSEEEEAEEALRSLRRQDSDAASEVAAREEELERVKGAHAAAQKRWIELKGRGAGAGLSIAASQSLMSQSAGGGGLPERLTRARADLKALKEDGHRQSLPIEINSIREQLDGIAKDERRLKDRRGVMESFQEEEREIDASLRRLQGLANKIAIETELQSDKLEDLAGQGLDGSLVASLPYDWPRVLGDLEAPTATLEGKLLQANDELSDAKGALAAAREAATKAEALTARDGDTRERIQEQLEALAAVPALVTEAAGVATAKGFTPRGGVPLEHQAEGILEALTELPEDAKQSEARVAGAIVIQGGFLHKIEQIDEGDPGACPCCERAFSTVADKADFIDKIKKRVSRAEGWQQKRAEAKEESVQMSERLRGVMRDWRSWMALTTQAEDLAKGIEDAKAQSAELGAKLGDLTAAADSKRIEVQTLDEALAGLRAHRTIVAEARDLAETVERSRADMAAKSSGGLASATYSSLKQQRSIVTLKDVTTALEELRSAKDDLVVREREHSEALATLEQRSNQMDERVRDLERQLRQEEEQRQELVAVTQQKDASKAEQKTLEDTLKELHRQRSDASGKLPAAERALAQRQAQGRDRVQERSNAFDACRADVAELERRAGEVAELVGKEFGARQREAMEEADRQGQTANALRTEIREIDDKATALQQGLADKENVRKTARQNLELRASKVALGEAEAELGAAENAFHEGAGADRRRLRQEATALQDRAAKEAEARAELRGVQRGLEQHRGELVQRLASKQYRDVAREHKRKLIEYETTQIAVLDLDKYYKAVDRALMSYHSMKITEINKIVRELWQLTYKGLDIEAIEIVGEEGGQTSASRARSYNYKVMMRKGDARLEMRGRCSAGQRVLAAIVIRLALAETFCLTCGILALDEPTTNLDFDNKLGLAHALAMIIGARSQQHNFQLVCITHDEEFVSMMNAQLQAQTGIPMPEYYWKIEREQLAAGRYFSRIDRVDWSDMQPAG